MKDKVLKIIFLSTIFFSFVSTNEMIAAINEIVRNDLIKKNVHQLEFLEM